MLVPECPHTRCNLLVHIPSSAALMVVFRRRGAMTVVLVGRTTTEHWSGTSEQSHTQAQPAETRVQNTFAMSYDLRDVIAGPENGAVWYRVWPSCAVIGFSARQ